MTASPPFPCPNCGSPYKTFLSAEYQQEVINNTKVPTVIARRYRCLGCGKSHTHTEKETNS